MTIGARLSHDGRSITVRVPMAFIRRGGRKLVISPNGVSTLAPLRPQVDNTMVKALARAFRWRKWLETGAFATVGEIAAAEKINPSYVSRVLRLTLLAPDIVEGCCQVKATIRHFGRFSPFVVRRILEASLILLGNFHDP
jgi:hypothetical protein